MIPVFLCFFIIVKGNQPQKNQRVKSTVHMKQLVDICGHVVLEADNPSFAGEFIKAIRKKRFRDRTLKGTIGKVGEVLCFPLFLFEHQYAEQHAERRINA